MLDEWWTMPNSMKNLTQYVYEDLRNKILLGGYPPNTQMVNRSIAKELSVSTIPVREAIQRLVSEGMVEQRHGDGFFVRVLTKRDLNEIYDMRAAFEPLAASYLATNSTPEIVQQFENVLAEWDLAATELVRDMGVAISDADRHPDLHYHDTTDPCDGCRNRAA